jgi:hypothetical protein
MSDPIRDGIQAFLDQSGEGWHLAHYVISMGLQRIRDGELESCSWQYFPPNQAGYITSGLLDAAGDALIQHDGEV